MILIFIRMTDTNSVIPEFVSGMTIADNVVLIRLRRTNDICRII